MLVQRRRVIGGRRLEEGFMLVWLENRPIEERNLLVQDVGIVGYLDVMGYRIRQPDLIVGKMRAHATPRRRKPPMLDITFGKLSTRRAQQMCAGQIRAR